MPRSSRVRATRQRFHLAAACGDNVVVVGRDVVEHGVHSAVAKFQIALCELVEDSNLGVFDLAGGSFAGRTDRYSQTLAFEVFGLGDRGVVGIDDNA